jgi:hypothetical protein
MASTATISDLRGEISVSLQIPRGSFTMEDSEGFELRDQEWAFFFRRSFIDLTLSISVE